MTPEYGGGGPWPFRLAVVCHLQDGASALNASAFAYVCIAECNLTPQNPKQRRSAGSVATEYTDTLSSEGMTRFI